MSTLSGTALADYGVPVFKRDHYTCVYCGFDGRLFDNWMQLSVDHVLPKKLGGANSLENLVTSCKACNSITSRMTFAQRVAREQVLEEKRKRISQRRKTSGYSLVPAPTAALKTCGLPPK